MKLHSIIVITLFAIITFATSIQFAVESLRPNMTTPADAPTFVFDLNGVLFDTDTVVVLRQLGIKDVFWYLSRYRSIKMIKNRFYQTLDLITKNKANIHGIKDTDGMQMPELMVDWLRGTYSNKLLLERVTLAINNNPQWFLSATEQRLMAAMARALFDPTQFAASRKLLVDLAPLIVRLKQSGAKLYILSNWDKESFELIKKRFSYVFAWFDGCIISGDVGYVKPESEIFARITNKTGSSPICYLDDQQENIDAGKKIGWYTILVNKTTSYFGIGSAIDVDTITKSALQFLENHTAQPSLLEKLHATQ